jgi:hypothetical protein
MAAAHLKAACARAPMLPASHRGDRHHHACGLASSCLHQAPLYLSVCSSCLLATASALLTQPTFVARIRFPPPAKHPPRCVHRLRAPPRCAVRQGDVSLPLLAAMFLSRQHPPPPHPRAVALAPPTPCPYPALDLSNNAPPPPFRHSPAYAAGCRESRGRQGPLKLRVAPARAVALPCTINPFKSPFAQTPQVDQAP